MQNFGEVAEWLKAHAWKACKREIVSGVRIPSSPLNYKKSKIMYRIITLTLLIPLSSICQKQYQNFDYKYTKKDSLTIIQINSTIESLTNEINKTNIFFEKINIKKIKKLEKKNNLNINYNTNTSIRNNFHNMSKKNQNIYSEYAKFKNNSIKYRLKIDSLNNELISIKNYGTNRFNINDLEIKENILIFNNREVSNSEILVENEKGTNITSTWHYEKNVFTKKKQWSNRDFFHNIFLSGKDLPFNDDYFKNIYKLLEDYYLLEDEDNIYNIDGTILFNKKNTTFFFDDIEYDLSVDAKEISLDSDDFFKLDRWYLNGNKNIEIIQNYNNNNVIINAWYRSGERRIEINTKRNTFKWYYPNGELLLEGIYANNFPISFIMYWPNGNISYKSIWSEDDFGNFGYKFYKSFDIYGQEQELELYQFIWAKTILNEKYWFEKNMHYYLTLPVPSLESLNSYAEKIIYRSANEEHNIIYSFMKNLMSLDNLVLPFKLKSLPCTVNQFSWESMLDY